MEEGAGGKAACEAAEKFCRDGGIAEPPHVRNNAETVDVDVARRDELKKAELAVGSPEAALLYATPGRLCYAVGVKNLVDHYGAGL